MPERLDLGSVQSPSVPLLWDIFQVRYLANGDGGGMLGGLQVHHIQLAGYHFNGPGPPGILDHPTYYQGGSHHWSGGLFFPLPWWGLGWLSSL